MMQRYKKKKYAEAVLIIPRLRLSVSNTWYFADTKLKRRREHNEEPVYEGLKKKSMKRIAREMSIA